MPHCLPAVQSLEPRCLLSIAPIMVNFQPANAIVPAGYRVDAGDAFGARGDLAYGWDAPTNFTRDRNSSASPDQRYDTLNHMQWRKTNRTWELAVPPGFYNVRLVAGDASAIDSVYRLNAEGQRIVDATPTSQQRWFEGIVSVPVIDGRLTIANAPGASNNKINFIEVTDAGPTAFAGRAQSNANGSPAVQLTWKNNALRASAIRIERSSDGVNYAAVATIPASVTSYTDLAVSRSDTYYYRLSVGSTAGWSQPSEAVRVTIPANPSFTFFDATVFRNKPDLSSLGMENIYVAYTEMYGGTYPNWDLSKPDEAACRALARKVSSLGRMLVLDIEHWNVNLLTTPQAEADANIAKLMQTVDWIKDERPDLKVGFFSLLPLGDYWTTSNYAHALIWASTSAWWSGNLPKFEAAYRQMQAANDYLMPLAAKVDFVCPSLYTFYEDQAGWRRVAELILQEAARFGKPVLPFLWMEYHEGGSARTNSIYVPADYWDMELQTVYAHADGVVVWGGYQTSWDEQAPWWQVTRDWLASTAQPTA